MTHGPAVARPEAVTLSGRDGILPSGPSQFYTESYLHRISSREQLPSADSTCRFRIADMVLGWGHEHFLPENYVLSEQICSRSKLAFASRRYASSRYASRYASSRYEYPYLGRYGPAFSLYSTISRTCQTVSGQGSLPVSSSCKYSLVRIAPFVCLLLLRCAHRRVPSDQQCSVRVQHTD
jgi:hypothetical protein